MQSALSGASPAPVRSPRVESFAASSLGAAFADPPSATSASASSPAIALSPAATQKPSTPSWAAASAAAPAATPSIAVLPPPFDPSRARVEFTVTNAAGGATIRAVQRALARATPHWNRCYRTTLERRGQTVDDQGSLHLTTDQTGNVVGARIDGVDALPHLKQCIAAAAHVHIDGVDTGEATADVRLVLRGD